MFREDPGVPGLCGFAVRFSVEAFFFGDESGGVWIVGGSFDTGLLVWALGVVGDTEKK